MGTELQVQSNEQGPMTANAVIAQVTAIQEVMRAAMKIDTHYGVVPGCGDKPTLLKPGAEKLALMFHLAPKYTVTMRDLTGGHREYEIVTDMYYAPTGVHLGSGVGAASTTETKWRYRWENTGKPVPKEYWDVRDPELLGGSDYVPRKVRGDGGQSWVIFHRVEHDNPSDYYNTVLKMAKKRSQIDATLTVTAASDIFTQDLEELRENGVDGAEAAEHVAPPPRTVQQPQPVNRKEDSASDSTAQGEASEATPMPDGAFMIKANLGQVKVDKKGKSPRYYTKAADNQWYSTFDEKVGQAMLELTETPVSLIYKLERTAKGEFRTVLSVGKIGEERGTNQNEKTHDEPF